MVAAVNARNSGAKTPGQAQVERMFILNMKRLAYPVLQTVVTRPTSAVKPTNVPSKVDSGLVRAGPGRTPVMRQQRSHSPARGQQRSHSPGPATSAASASRTRGQQPRPQSPGGGGRGKPRSQSAGPSRSSGLQHRQVASLKSATAAASPELPRKPQQIHNLADDEASDTENELRWAVGDFISFQQVLILFAENSIKRQNENHILF